MDYDTKLFMDFKAGNKEAFTELFHRNYDRLLGVAITVLKNPNAADDIVQKAFVKIYKAASRFNPTAKFGTWSFRIVQRLALTKIKPTIESKKTFEMPENDYLLGRRSHVLDPILLNELHDQINLAIDRLPPRQKQAMLLLEKENTYAEIGKVVGCGSMCATKNLISRARITLREQLKEYVEL